MYVENKFLGRDLMEKVTKFLIIVKLKFKNLKKKHNF